MIAPVKEYYKRPTKKIWRKIGDAILYTCGAGGGSGLMFFDQLQKMYSSLVIKTIVGVLFVVSLLGKFVSNFFKEDNDERNTDSGDKEKQV